MTAASPSRTSKRRRPIVQAVPSSVLQQVSAAIRAEPDLPAAAIARIHERFDLQRAYNVSRRQFSRYAGKLFNERAGADADRNDFPDESAPETAAFRKRMRQTGEVLSTMAEALADYDPVQWGRGVYLALIGRVFDTLNGRKTGIALDDLNLLSKIVAEQRRAETQSAELQYKVRDKKEDDSEGSDTGAARDLPENFGKIIRQIYGTNFQTDVRSTDPDEQAHPLPAGDWHKAGGLPPQEVGDTMIEPRE